MEKITKSYELRFPPCKVYLNQIDEMVKAVSKLCDEVEICTDEYKLRDAEELRELKEATVQAIVIQCNQPYLFISLRKFGARLYASTDTIDIKGVGEEIKQIIGRHERKLFRFLMSGPLLGLASGIPFGIAGVYLWRKEFIPAFILLFSGLLVVIVGVVLEEKRKVIFSFSNETEESSFFSRKRDEILLSLISAFAGASFTYFLMKYL